MTEPIPEIKDPVELVIDVTITANTHRGKMVPASIKVTHERGYPPGIGTLVAGLLEDIHQKGGLQGVTELSLHAEVK